MHHKVWKTSLLVFILLVAITWMPVFAQRNDMIITVAIEEWQQDVFNDELFTLFEAENPNVKVVPVILAQDDRIYGRPFSTEQESIDDYLERVENFASIADVLPVDSFGYDIHATRTGAFLNLMPLISADPDAGLDDFYPAMLESFNWDAATWGLPLSGSVQVIIYNQSRFDELRLPYPDATWTINDYVEIGRQLTEYNDDGEATLPGFFGFDNRLLYRAFLGHNLLDETAFPPQPQLFDPNLITMLETWSAFEADTIPSFEDGPSFDFNAIPMTISGLWRIDNSFGGGSGDDYAAALLPRGTAGLQVQGYAISAGTPHPEIAYELVQWMTRSPDVVNRMFGDRPARRSLIDVEGQLESNVFFPERSEEVEAMIEEALVVAIPTSELHYFDYLFSVINEIQTDGIDPETALQNTQQEALDILAAIEASSQDTVVTVATPIPTPVLSTGEISLNFGIQSFTMPMPNRDSWLVAIDDFTAQDSEVRHIELMTDFMGLEEQAETQDCFILNSNVVPTTDLSLLLAVDPFLAADPNFNPNDIVTGALQQVTSGGNIYAVPLTIQPYVIWYNPQLFEEAGVFEPFNGWNVSDFENTLRDYYNATGNAAYQSQSFGGNYILQLIAAYGGRPIDYSTEPYTYHLTDAAFIQAAQQVLDLAKAGYISYQELSSFGGGGLGRQAAIYDSVMRTDDWRLQNRGTDDEGFNTPYRLVTFPVGINVKPIAYDLSGAYISSQTQYPEACYRWISFLGQRPELLTSMPARRSLIEATAATVANSDDILALFQEIDSILQDPNVLILPGQFSGGSSTNPAAPFINFMGSLWMNRGFDAYVLEEADLLTEMQTAQRFIEEFIACSDSIAPPALPLDEMQREQVTAYFDQFDQCAMTVDPAMEEFFGD